MAGATLHSRLTLATALLVLVFTVRLALLFGRRCSPGTPFAIFALVVRLVLRHGNLQRLFSHQLTRAGGFRSRSDSQERLHPSALILAAGCTGPQGGDVVDAVRL